MITSETLQPSLPAQSLSICAASLIVNYVMKRLLPVIVVLHRSASRDTAKDAANIEDVIQQYVDPARDTVHHRFENVLSGFAETLSAGAVSALAADSRVDHI